MEKGYEALKQRQAGQNQKIQRIEMFESAHRKKSEELERRARLLEDKQSEALAQASLDDLAAAIATATGIPVDSQKLVAMLKALS